MEKFKFLLADPPWKFKVFSEKGMSRSAENHYPCMSTEDIAELPVDALMADDSVCMLWVTPPFLQIGMDVLRKWGFIYKTMGGWVKTRDGKLQQGTGYHLRACMEPFLIGTRGRGYCPPQGTQKSSCLISQLNTLSDIIEPEDYFLERMRHSAKPLETFDYAELYPGPYLQIFGRRLRPGWTVLGNEITGNDIREDLGNLIGELSVPHVERIMERRKKIGNMIFAHMTNREACNLGRYDEWAQAAYLHFAYNGGI